MIKIDILIEQGSHGEYYGTAQYDYNLIVENSETEEELISKVKQSISETCKIGLNKCDFILKYDRKLLKKRLNEQIAKVSI